ncbi:MAG: hypothetical protein WDN27_05155 [Candidatus Saccharibacteria bacterium]
MLKTIDAILNKYTMYKIVAWGLRALLLVAGVLMFTGAVSLPYKGLIYSILVLITAAYLSNKLFAWMFRAHANTDSWAITALILACILPPSTSVSRLGLLALAAVIAMASKYVLVWRGSHFLNPAATAAFVLSVTGLLPATWWVAMPVLLPFTGLLALVVLRKQRKFALAFAFGIPAVLMLLYIGVGIHGFGFGDTLKGALGSWPIVFMGSIMLTEPTTLPPTRYYQLLFGALIGVIFSSQLHIWRIYSTPETALLVGNIFTLLVAPTAGAMLRLKFISQLAPNQYDLAFEKPPHVRFDAGQYLEWTLPHKHADARGVRRTFSIASAPTESELHIGIKTYERGSTFKKALLALKPGDRVRAAHVAGSFTLPADASRPLVFIAGGIGITPFRAMAQYLTDTNQLRDAALLYVANSEADSLTATCSMMLPRPGCRPATSSAVWTTRHWPRRRSSRKAWCMSRGRTPWSRTPSRC